jgi:hypothetical protein
MMTQYWPHIHESHRMCRNALLLRQESPGAYCKKDNSPISKLIESERFMALSRWFVYIPPEFNVVPLLTTALASVTDWAGV